MIRAMVRAITIPKTTPTHPHVYVIPRVRVLVHISLSVHVDVRLVRQCLPLRISQRDLALGRSLEVLSKSVGCRQVYISVVHTSGGGDRVLTYILGGVSPPTQDRFTGLRVELDL